MEGKFRAVVPTRSQECHSQPISVSDWFCFPAQHTKHFGVKRMVIINLAIVSLKLIIVTRMHPVPKTNNK